MKKIISSVFCAAALVAQGDVFDVRTYGAKGDGVTKDTASIQKAIDAAAAAGGGEVLLPPGTYLSGSIFLKSGIDFHIAQGATLKASPDAADYNALDVAPQNWGGLGKGDNMSGGHLLLCIEQENVTLRGPGKIDGNAPSFLRMPDGTHPPSKLKIPWRPSQMVWFVESKNIVIRDIELADAPYWSCFVHGCEDVVVERANIHTIRKPHTYNGDGLDIDCSRRVRVSGCTISTADDSITLRADGKKLKRDGDCADVVVTDCTLSSDCNAIRIGVGNGTIRDCSFSNIRIVNTRYAVNAVGAWSRPEHGVDIYRISLRDMTIDAKRFCMFYYKLATGSEFDGITFTRVRGKVSTPSVFDDTAERPFRNIRFYDVQLEGETSPRVKSSESRGKLVLSFDDRNLDDWERALPIFERYGARATFFVSGPIDAATARRLSAIGAKGHSIGLHGLNHMNADDAVASLGAERYWEREVKPQLDACRAAGIRITSFAYPNCRRSPESDELFRSKGFAHVRGGHRDVAPYDPKGEKRSSLAPISSVDRAFLATSALESRFRLDTVIAGEAYQTDIEEILRCVRRCAERDEAFVLTSHGISPDAKSINMKTEWLERILATAEECGVAVVGFDELESVPRGFEIYNIVPFSPGREKEAAADVVDLKERTGADLALYNLSLHPEGRPAIDRARRYVASFREFKKALEGTGVRAGVLVQSILGHWPMVYKDIEDWTRTVDVKGKEVRFCPDDPGFAAYIDEVFEMIARESPAFVLTDDDVRAFSHEAECFCPRHVAKFNERRGTSYTSEQLRARITEAKQDDPDYVAFMAIQREMVEGVVRRARAAMDRVDPSIPAGICVAGEEHFLCAPLARAIATKGQTPVLRASTGLYNERMTCASFPRVACRILAFSEFLRGSGIDLLGESDSCPHNLWSKSGMSFSTHLQTTAFAGMKGAKTWFVNCTKGGHPVSRSYTRALKGLPRLSAISAAVEGGEWEGLAVPCFTKPHSWHVANGHYEFLLDERSVAPEIFVPFGIPFHASRDFGGGGLFALGTAAEVSRLSDDEIRRMFSGKVVVFRDAAMALTERGFSDLMGVKAEWWNLVFNCERNDMNGDLAPYTPMCGSVKFTIAEGAETLSSLVFRRPSGDSFDVASPASVLYTNKLGGKVLTLQYHHHMFCLQQFSESRRDLLVAAIERLYGSQLPFMSGHDQNVLTLVRRRTEGQWVVLAANLNSEPIERLRLRTPWRDLLVEVLNEDGTWRRVESSYDGGILSCDVAIPFYGTALVRATRREVVLRDGIGNFREKALAGAPVKVAYLGGSITEMKGWRDLTTEWLRKEFPKAKIEEVAASIGGTGSDLGVFRVGPDALDHHPDLLFVEFATNDGNRSRDKIVRQMEGIVRQTWTRNPRTDIVFVYTITEHSARQYADGGVQNAVVPMEKVAEHYGIPSVDFSYRILAEVAAHRLVMSMKELETAVPPDTPDRDKAIAAKLAAEGKVLFARDGVHPAMPGHEFYLKSIKSLFAIAKDDPPADHSTKMELPPVDPANLCEAKMVPVTRDMLKGEWKKSGPMNANARFALRMGEIWESNTPGSKLCFSFRGSHCDVYDLLGPDGGQVWVTVDGKRSAAPVPRFDSYCTYHRIAHLPVFDGEYGLHTVEIEIDSKQPSRQPVAFRLGNPEKELAGPKYNGTKFWPAKIMVVGDIVEERPGS